MKIKNNTKSSIKETESRQGSTKKGKRNDPTYKIALSNVKASKNADKSGDKSIASTSAHTSSETSLDQQTPDIRCAAYGLFN